MRRLSRRLVLPIFGVLWITVLLFFWVTKKKLEVPTGPEVQTPKISDGDWDDLWDQFDERRYLNAKKWRVGDDPYKLYAFNQRESERIASNRVVPDTRLFRCTLLVYCADLPPTSIIIAFHNEARSTLLRTIRRAAVSLGNSRAHRPNELSSTWHVPHLWGQLSVPSYPWPQTDWFLLPAACPICPGFCIHPTSHCLIQI